MKNMLKLALISIFLLPSLAFAEVNVVSWGGAYTESQKLGYGDPYQEKSGVKVNWIDYSGGLSEIRTQVESGNVTWNIVDLYAKDTITGCDEGLLVEFDFDKDFPAAPDGTPASEDFFTDMPSDCAVGNILYSWNYAFNPNAFPGQDVMPSTIVDFYDTAKYPGKRSIYTSAMSNIEQALVADGVKASAVYDVLENQTGALDRAINKIRSLCEDPNGGCIFWSAGAQPPELLASGEVVMATGWNGRFFNAIVGEGTTIEQVWDAQILDYEYFAMVKGAPNQEEAMEALRYFTGTEGLAGSAKYIAYAPWRISSLDIIEAGEPWYKDGTTNMMPNMPTAPANTANSILMNPDYWADNEVEIGEAWESFKSSL
jgi:putative spermidine/putrescine transport system substrate-binding protein